MTERQSAVGIACAEPAGERQAAVVTTLENSAEAAGAALRRLPPGIAGVEVRADLAGDLDPSALRRHFAGQLIYSLRSQRSGGRSADPPPVRQARLLAAARGYDVVELESDHDLVPDLLAAIPADRRRISWYGASAELGGLRERFARMVRVPAALYLLAPRADSFLAALAPLRLLASLGRADVTAFGTGPAATFSRVLAPWLGAPVVYGGSAGPTVDQLVADYPFPRLPRLASLGGIVGRSLHTSLFLRLVNTAFQERSVPRLFLPFVVPDLADFQSRFWPAIAAGSLDQLGLPLKGLTVAVPYKPAAFAAAAQADPSARAAQAANLLLQQDKGWRAATTDGSAMLAALRVQRPIAGESVAVIGCGSAGRAAAYALSDAGARVTLVNRGMSRGRRAAAWLGLPFVPLAAFQPGRYLVLVHATPVEDRLPFPLDDVPSGAMIADFLCRAEPTALVAAAQRRGLTTVDGSAVLTEEARHQFRLMTGQPMPSLQPLSTR